tara:strand:- start:4436 stop:5047 length:612 start_codon:yes stop_codon:yes gene_type:complete
MYIQDKKELANFFTEDYFNSINYIGYAGREEKYRKTAIDIVAEIGIPAETIRVLDYGCGIGLLIKGLMALNCEKVVGYDISEWAVKTARKAELPVTKEMFFVGEQYDLVTMLDVLEHMFDEDIEALFARISTKRIFVRIPVKEEGDNDFFLDCSKADKSHVNCKTKDEWITYIEKLGYAFTGCINAETIYDAKGCFCGKFNRR